MHLLRLIIPLWLLYLAVTANLEPANLVVGGLLAGGVSLLLRPRARAVAWRQLPAALLALARYVWVLAWDLVFSGVQVARIVLDPRLPIAPGIIAIPAQCETEMGAALSAHAITLTPGELVVEMDNAGTLYTHCLDISHADEYVADAQRLRRDLLRKISA
ncbi:MAG: Na+/H+ antiporter subunit E [Anaerolineales bacterium]|nr:Na+/H+ antiporter subunit E [Anaerolineales bacterium]MCB8950460.1 Na+/H+ antiporter subunit E [Ardenticatenales bacterium]